jgi:hypothetical protein
VENRSLKTETDMDNNEVRAWGELNEAEKAEVIEWWPHQVDKDQAHKYSYEYVDGKLDSACGGTLL